MNRLSRGSHACAVRECYREQLAGCRGVALVLWRRVDRRDRSVSGVMDVHDVMCSG